MTFDEMEVGKWYWFRFAKPGGIVACGVCIVPGDEPVRHRLMTLAGNLNKSDVTDITPVPSQSEWAALQENYTEKCEQLATVHQHVAEALQLLGVDTSVNGFVPDSWTLREQCKIAAEKLAGEALKKVGEA